MYSNRNRIEDCNECDILATNQYQWIKSFFYVCRYFALKDYYKNQNSHGKKSYFHGLICDFSLTGRIIHTRNSTFHNSAFHTIIQLVETRVQETKRKLHGIYSINYESEWEVQIQAWRTFFIKSIEIMTASW